LCARLQRRPVLAIVESPVPVIRERQEWRRPTFSSPDAGLHGGDLPGDLAALDLQRTTHLAFEVDPPALVLLEDRRIDVQGIPR